MPSSIDVSEGAAAVLVLLAMAKQQSSEVIPAIFSNGVMIAGVIVVVRAVIYEHALGQSERDCLRELPATGEQMACNFCRVTREFLLP